MFYAHSVEDVSAAVKCAASAGVKVSPSCGRQSFQGWTVMDGYLTVDVTNLTEVRCGLLHLQSPQSHATALVCSQSCSVRQCLGSLPCKPTPASKFLEGLGAPAHLLAKRMGSARTHLSELQRTPACGPASLALPAWLAAQVTLNDNSTVTIGAGNNGVMVQTAVHDLGIPGALVPGGYASFVGVSGKTIAPCGW